MTPQQREQSIRLLDSAIALFGLTAAALCLFATDLVAANEGGIGILDTGICIALACDLIARLFLRPNFRGFLRRDRAAIAASLCFALVSLWRPTSGAYFALQELSLTTLLSLGIFVRALIMCARVAPTLISVRDIFANTHTQPARAILFGFAAVILTGALLLSLPQATRQGVTLPFIDALFMATSSVCVTGLSVCNIGADFTVFGQIVILLLVQVGGLGIMTIAVSLALALRARVSLREQSTAFDELDTFRPENLRALVREIIRLVLTIEFAGALLIFAWHQFVIPRPEGHDLVSNLFYAAFHAVSAFCSSGFSLNTESLMPYAGDPVIVCAVAALSFLGSLGFIVIVESRAWLRARRLRQRKPLSLHSKIVLAATAILIVSGALAFYSLEWDNTLRGAAFGESLLSSVFQSSASRTAGFSTVDLTLARPATLLVLIVLMFIGSSPGSTGGGIKTTTFAVMWFTIGSIIRNRGSVVAMNRAIPREIVNKALAIIACFLTIIFAGCLLLLVIQPGLDFLAILFEVVSAAGTVGLSAGITPELTPLSRLVIIFVMFLGRIGPLTLIIAFSKPARSATERYPQERIMVG